MQSRHTDLLICDVDYLCLCQAWSLSALAQPSAHIQPPAAYLLGKAACPGSEADLAWPNTSNQAAS